MQNRPIKLGEKPETQYAHSNNFDLSKYVNGFNCKILDVFEYDSTKYGKALNIIISTPIEKMTISKLFNIQRIYEDRELDKNSGIGKIFDVFKIDNVNKFSSMIGKELFVIPSYHKVKNEYRTDESGNIYITYDVISIPEQKTFTQDNIKKHKSIGEICDFCKKYVKVNDDEEISKRYMSEHIKSNCQNHLVEGE